MLSGLLWICPTESLLWDVCDANEAGFRAYSSHLSHFRYQQRKSVQNIQSCQSPAICSPKLRLKVWIFLRFSSTSIVKDFICLRQTFMKEPWEKSGGPVLKFTWYWLGQSALQVIFCTDMPSQNAPPLRGAGLVQVRDRFWTPRPHGTLQADHSVHKDQPPFTGKKSTKLAEKKKQTRLFSSHRSL